MLQELSDVSFLTPFISLTGSLSDAWREELKELAARVSASFSTEMAQKEVVSFSYCERDT